MRQRLIAGVLTALIVGGGLSAAAAAGLSTTGLLGDNVVGQQPDGSYLLSTGQYVTPVGEVIRQKGRPFGLAVSPDGRTAAALRSGPGVGYVSVFDLTTGAVLQQIGTGRRSTGGIVYSTDGRYLWAARPRTLQRFPVNPDGTLGSPIAVSLPGVGGRNPVPAGLAWAPDGALLVTLSGNNTLGIVDTTTNRLVRQIAVGNLPNSVVVIDGMAYVSNQGGRRARATDQTARSDGTAIVTNNDSAVPSTGMVSEVDLATERRVRGFRVGRQPSALLAVGKTLLVANSDDDSVTSIDTVAQAVGRTFTTNPAPGAPLGASPDGMTMLDATHLAVSLGRDNAVAVYGYSGAYTPPSFEGLIPTGAYPSGIAVDPQLNQLLIASAQGLGSMGGSRASDSVGTVQQIGMPLSAQMDAWTQQVFANNEWNGLLDRNQSGDGTAAPVAVPLQIGDPSTIQHVFLIIKENRTYDQVLGDDPRGNGDASLAQFGAGITPNIHALAQQFPLIDNLYSDGANSTEGHHWLDQAFVNNYVAQRYGTHLRGDAMSNAASGWIWEDALAHGKTVANWGEQVDRYVDANGAPPPPGSWANWLHDAQALDGTLAEPLTYPLGTYAATSEIPSLQNLTEPTFPGFDLNVPDQYRAALFDRDFAQHVANGNLPNLNLMWLPSDHTSGTLPGAITPQAHVADGDLALGRIVDTISHSPYWPTSAIFVLEDDSQNGLDHVDGHRNPTLVISPYARRGAVVHTYYSQLNVVRTIEQILGIPPMNQQDLTAEPMFDVFTDTPDLTPYTDLPSQVALTDTNPQVSNTASAVEQAWAKWAKRQDWSSEDMLNMAQGDRDLWYATHHFTKPYPGDRTVLYPSQARTATP